MLQLGMEFSLDHIHKAYQSELQFHNEDMTSVSVNLRQALKKARIVKKSSLTKICTKIGIGSPRGYPMVDIDNNNNGTEPTDPRNNEFTTLRRVPNTIPNPSAVKVKIKMVE